MGVLRLCKGWAVHVVPPISMQHFISVRKAQTVQTVLVLVKEKRQTTGLECTSKLDTAHLGSHAKAGDVVVQQQGLQEST
jgi:hypothetical protein